MQNDSIICVFWGIHKHVNVTFFNLRLIHIQQMKSNLVEEDSWELQQAGVSITDSKLYSVNNEILAGISCKLVLKNRI